MKGINVVMRSAQKREMLEFINSLHQAHMEVKEALQQHNYDTVQNMLSECQDFAVILGENIEKLEGEGHITVSHVEEYCETLFQVFKEITDGKVNENRIYKILRRRLLNVENSVKNDISVRKEVAFFPYKASMWDSLESIYLAAKEDPECDAYCVPIPYFDLNLDNSFGKMHYEGGEYPEGIEIIDWEKYNFEDRRPDVIYIHNPYDEYNLVVSVHPRYYSSNLKKYTDTLVYVPYFISSGGMLEGQSLLSAYGNADYIVIQSPQFRKYFDQSIPDEKFLPFGSPKVDRVLNKCKNLPKPPEEWKEKMYDEEGRKKRVIFYNITLNDMLLHTDKFFKKMEYVFKCFAKREDVCLLWRPHPLMRQTLDSLRPDYRIVYEILEKKYIDSGLGIYDTTPDVTDAVALSDAYIGDAGSSITALFGVAGKPIFILNNQILEEPGEEGWRKDIYLNFDYREQDRFHIIQGNKLYVSEPYQYNYSFFCDLAKDVYVKHYHRVYEISGKWYACPLNTQDILVIGKNGIEKKVILEKKVDGGALFTYPEKFEKYLLLPPLYYSAIVRYDTVTDEIRYFSENIDVFVKEKNGKKIVGDSLVYQGALYIASPTDNKVYKLEIDSGESSVIELPIRSRCGGQVLVEFKGEIWIMPYDGQVIVRWNPEANTVREYEGFPEGFLCKNPADDSECTEQPFSMPAFSGEYIYLLSYWSNMSLKLNINTGEFKQWIPAYESKKYEIEDLKENAMFLDYKLEEKEKSFKVYSFSRNKIYNINLDENDYEEMEIQFDINELEKNESGFCEHSASLPYACIENHFNTLSRFLDGKTVGNQYSQEKQFAVCKKIIANCDGGCGEKVHEFVKKAR